MKKSVFDVLFHDQWVKQPSVTAVDLTGKTVIITGANTGLGLEASIHFARMNPARLIMASRSIQRGEDALKRLVAETGCTTAEVWPLDLGSFASVKAFADKFSQLSDTRLDILVENAGINTLRYTQSADGWESTLQVNCLSSSYHTLRLLPFMLSTVEKYSTVPRIVILSSELHYFAQDIDKQILANPNILERLSSQEYCTSSVMRNRYPLSKLLNVFFVRALAKRLAPNKIIIDAVNPGMCESELGRDFPWIIQKIGAVIRYFFAHSTEGGSRHIVFGALGGGEELHGQYMTNSAVEEGSDYALSEEGLEVQERIWKEMVELFEKTDPTMKGIVDTLR